MYYWLVIKYLKKENFDLLFNLIDSNNTGKIGKDEFRKAASDYELNLSDRDIEIMINYSSS